MSEKLSPLAKHDLLLSSSPVSYENLDEILTSWRLNQPVKSHKLAVVYTYKEDSPKTMLSSKLDVLGYCNLNVASILLNFSDHWHSCHLGVKRADGANRSNLNPEALKNSSDFASFVKKQLHRKCQAAIIGCDSKGRCGIITCTLQDVRNAPSNCIPQKKEYNGWEYFVSCFLISVDEVSKCAIKVSISNHTQTSKIDDVPLWRPPEAADESINIQSQLPLGSMNYSFDQYTSSFTDPPTSNVNISSNRKRHHSQLESNNSLNGSFHSNYGAAAADKFYSNLTRSLDTRSSSRLFHMRNFNGWIKACQIAELTPQTILQKSNPNKKSTSKHNHPLRILDLACGKGGDLGKWIRHDRGVQTYVGIDVARGSLKDAAIRARTMRDSFKNGACKFICADLGADLLRPKIPHVGAPQEDEDKCISKQEEPTPQLLCWSLAKEIPDEKGEPHFTLEKYGGISQDALFDVVSIQFAIHYMMSTRQRASTFFRTVSDLLDVGGNLIITTIDARVVLEYIMDSGYDFHKISEDKDEAFVINIANGACRLKFNKDVIQKIFTRCDRNGLSPMSDEYFGLEYTFTLVEGDDHAAGVGEAVDLPEWLSPLPVIEALATDVGLKLDYAVNFHEFYSMRKNPITHAKAHLALYSMKVLNRNGTISDDEWEISRLYVAMKFTKVSTNKS